MSNDLRSYQDQFGNINFKEGDEARSIYSPAAYLADLIQLLDDFFQGSDQNAKRPDIKEIPLDGEHTFSQLPYLDIVNKLLLQKTGGSYAGLAKHQFPLNLPFNLQDEKTQLFLDYLGVDRNTIHRLYNTTNDSDDAARYSLGLSKEIYASIINIDEESNEEALLAQLDIESLDKLHELSTFLGKTDIQSSDLMALIHPSENKEDEYWFTYVGQGGQVSLDSSETGLIWNRIETVSTEEDDSGIPVAWFTRAIRLIRLSQQTHLSIRDLYICLRDCCFNQLDSHAIQTLAVLKSIVDEYGVEMDVACSLFNHMHTEWQDGESPNDLFNKVYNNRFIAQDKRYIKLQHLIPEAFTSKDSDGEDAFTPLEYQGDLFSKANVGLRERIQQALHISEADLRRMAAALNEKLAKSMTEEGEQTLGSDPLSKLSFFHRVSTLSELMDMSISDLFILLDLLELDPGIRSSQGFSVLIHYSVKELNAYQILAQGDVQQSMWLVQLLLAMAQWMQSSEFTASELQAVMTGKLADEDDQKVAEQQLISGFKGLYEQLKPFLFNSQSLHTENTDLRSARIIYSALLANESPVVSEQDSRILRAEDSELRQAIHHGLQQLGFFTANDFKDLAITQKMQDKIVSSLIRKGVLQTDGVIVAEGMPADDDDFMIDDEFDDEGIFTGIADALRLHLNDGHSAADFALYPSDFDASDLSGEAGQCLYENLIFNGYIEEDGSVNSPDFFADEANAQRFSLTTKINQYGEQIRLLLAEKTAGFIEAECVLNEAMFTVLPLKNIERTALIENLYFNDYIDENGFVIEKLRMLELQPNDIELALIYYPYRQQILEIIKSELMVLREEYYRFSVDDFLGLAQQIVADDIFESLQQYYLQDGLFNREGQHFFANEENSDKLALSHYFDANSRRIVFKAIVRMLDTVKRYQLRREDFEALGLADDERDDLWQLLIDNNYINKHGGLSSEQTHYFLIINNALDIQLNDYEDYAKDIFFIIHDLAKRIDATVSELTQRLLDQAQKQAEIVFASLQELFEVSEDMVQVISQHVLGTKQYLPEQFLAPILTTVDANEQINHLPNNRIFSIALNRIRQFAWIASKLDLNAVEADIIFRDQNLADKFTEKLSLPKHVQRIDCLFRLTVEADKFPQIDADGKVDVILLTHRDHYWLYDSNDYQLLADSNQLSRLSPILADKTIDTGFNDPQGNVWLVAGSEFYIQQAGQIDWEVHEKSLGLVESNFTDPEKIDAAFMDGDNKLYLFAGDQYLRSTDNLQTIDEGYPKKIAGNWVQEHNADLPEAYQESLDGVFQDSDDKRYYFKDKHFIQSDDLNTEIAIRDVWGKLDNNFSDTTKSLNKIDAALAHDGKVSFFSGDQCLSWSYGVEHSQGMADEGSIQSLESMITGLPDDFKEGIDCIFRDANEQIHVCKDEKIIQCDQHFKVMQVHPKLNAEWGKVTNPLSSNGKISAALMGLDGKVYLFSGSKFYRYSSANYAYVDAGYPKSIAKHWGGLNRVNAAFILDGKTYLIGTNTANEIIYARYSSNDYTVQDTDYPQPVTDNWWMDHFNLNPEDHSADFTQPDNVFIGKDGVSYLFKGEHYIAYDKLHRWWSEPAFIHEKWAGFEFEQIDAGFTGKDGRTWLFSGTKHLRYSDKNFNRLDDRYPKASRSVWGQVKNNIQKNNRIDAGVTLSDTDGEGTVTQRLYLFSGDQYVRYSGSNYSRVDEGYPQNLDQLKTEPRFSNLDMDLEKGIDAACADQRHVYLFSGQECHSTSESDYRLYANRLEHKPQAVVDDNGKLYIETEAGWQTLPGLEAGGHVHQSSQGPLRSRIPEGISNISAAFIGADNVAYVFDNNGQCYNDALEKRYPINEEWGNSDNRIIEDNHIDAAFTATDDKTYVFSGDQYFVYEAESLKGHIPSAVKGQAGSIAEDWGGLENVHIAFIRDDKTWLIEAPDEKGDFRYVSYANDDYSQAECEPKTADINWWEFPTAYIEEGFAQVDAVLIEDEHLYLFSGEQFIQYNSEEDIWTYPRPLNRIWRNPPFTGDTGKDIHAVFTDSHGKTWFFSESHFAVYSNQEFNGDAQAIDTAWGRSDNALIDNNRVDAAIVLDDKTYLFSAQQYVRYSSEDYREIDAGYPKPIIKGLRQEEAFSHLPESFDERMQALAEENDKLGISGIIADERNIYIFETIHCHAISRNISGQFPISRLGQLKNNLQETGTVDAAVRNAEKQLFLFSGDQYVRYSDNDYRSVDTGYPKSIRENFAIEAQGVMVDTAGGIDAAVLLPETTNAQTQETQPAQILLFKGSQTYDSVSPQSQALLERIPAQKNVFESGIDTGFIDKEGVAWFFKGSQHIRYQSFENDYVDEGYPKAIRDHWGNLPESFEQNIDHSFVFEGKTYLVRGNEYVRYSHPDYQRLDALYPQPFTFRWGKWADYLLADIRIISEFKHLLDRNVSADYTLQELLNLEAGYKQEPYLRLSEIFGWELNEIKWIKRKNAFLDAGSSHEANVNIELVLKMQAMFDVANKLGTTPQRLYHDFYLHDYQQKDVTQAAQKLYAWLQTNTTSQKDWETLSSELHDKENQLKHAALLPLVIHLEEDVNNARDLFAQMLIDVNMGPDARTSEIKEAISAIQLYIHRFFVNLEEGDFSSSAKREQLKDWWKWMRNYRVWEANRKVFLYPENYIRPELRDTKSPAFARLEEALLQGEVTQDLVSKAFNNYLNEFSQVGNLKITGANAYKDPRYPEDDSLVLFGHTRTDPTQYYYRTVRFTETDSVLWGNWLPLELNIKSTRVFPVFAFGRIMVFWTEIEGYEETKPIIYTDGKESKETSTSNIETRETILKHRTDIKYSFYDFNKQWVSPQTLVSGREIEYQLDAAYVEGESIVTFAGKFCLSSTKQNPQGDLQLITEKYGNKFPFPDGIDAAVVFAGMKIVFSGDQCAYEIEGGWEKHLIKEVFAPAVITEHNLKTLETIDWILGFIPTYTIHLEQQVTFNEAVAAFQFGVGAAFSVGNKLCLIDKLGKPTFMVKSSDDVRFIEETYAKHETRSIGIFGLFERNIINIVTRNLTSLAPVDAIFEDEKKIIYVIRGGQYECYSYLERNNKAESPLELLDGFPKPLKGNLSFNIDKFFNRLHIAPSSVGGQEQLNLSYINPNANSPLLTGKIYDDFSFIEGDLRVDYDKQLLLESRNRIGLGAESSIVQSSTIPDGWGAFFESVKVEINALLPSDQMHFGILKKAIPNFETAMQNLSNFIGSQGGDDNSQAEADWGEAFWALMKGKAVTHDNEASAGVIEALKTLGDSILLDRAIALTDAYKAFIPGDTDAQDKFEVLQTLFNELSATNSPLHKIDFNLEMQALRFQMSVRKIKRYTDRSHSMRMTYYDFHSAFESRLLAKKKDMEADAIHRFDKLIRGYKKNVNDVATDKWTNDLSTSIKDMLRRENVSEFKDDIEKTLGSIDAYQEELEGLQQDAWDVDQAFIDLPQQLIEGIDKRLEEAFGKDDIFPSEFGIKNQSNFTFGEPDWHIFVAKLGTFLCRPTTEVSQADANAPTKPRYHYEILRLTTRTIPRLSKRLFSGGIEKLLTLESQYEDEQPYFGRVETRQASRVATENIDNQSSENTIRYKADFIHKVPRGEHLDYQGANKNYYWEIFFHAPFLIAQTLNDAQKFEEAKEWYEYIFDPTRIDANWGFLPCKKLDALYTPLEGQLNSPLVVNDLKTEIEMYLNDPFDPHAIASIRKIAYQKTIVMRYVDNLLDWGDMLFRQYTIESINEARMLYVLAYDLLGDKPQSFGKKILPKTRSYDQLKNPDSDETDLLLPIKQLDAGQTTELIIVENSNKANPHTAVPNPYFHIPDNDLFLDYWNRVEDRLYKIRNSLNIDGVKQALPLFQPPLDPMSIVQAVAGGGGLSQVLSASNVAVPHYRFGFMLNKARELTQKLNQYSGELLSAIEKRDSEQLSLLQNKQEGIILNMMTQVKEAQIEDARQSIMSLEASLEMVKANQAYNQSTVDVDLLPQEIVQVGLMTQALTLHAVAVISHIISVAGAVVPQLKVGPFISGTETGGEQFKNVFDGIAETASSAAEGMSIGGELAGIMAQHRRMMDDTKHQADTAIHDIEQISAQIEGAKQQLKIAEYELAIHKKEIEQHQSITTFMKDKFSNEQLYQWMSGKLSGLYYQTYKMAWDMAKSAEKAFQYERGIKESEVNYITGNYWNSQRKGLLAGDSLGLDLDRLEKAFIETNQRRLQITKSVSLKELDPLALIQLKVRGYCEFELSEALFDYDFQGHYCRQINTLEVEFAAPDGVTVNATLTQLNHKTVMEPDPKAIKYLMEPKDSQPLSIRSDWRANQQIVLSHTDEYEKPTGLFELRYDDVRYLPFEGTGAVSRWRLELNGKQSAYDREALANVTLIVKYTAKQGGEGFADAVRGLLKPYQAVRLLDVNQDFQNAWLDYLNNDDRVLKLRLTRDLFPDMAGSRITGIFTNLQSEDSASTSLILNGNGNMQLRDQQFTDTAGLSVRAQGSDWHLSVQGNKAALKNVQLVVGYKAHV